MTEVVTEMPRCCSIFIQSERARRRSPLALTSPARWMAPPNSRSFSVSVVLPASGCEMIAKVRRRAAASAAGEAARVKEVLRSGERYVGDGGAREKERCWDGMCSWDVAASGAWHRTG